MPDVMRSSASVRRERTLLVGLHGLPARPGGRGGQGSGVRGQGSDEGVRGQGSGLPSLRPFVPSSLRPPDPAERLLELRRLAETAGANVVTALTLRHRRVHPDLFLGRGRVERITRIVAEHDVDVVVFDTDLAPAQTHNLEARFQCKVIDRSELILDIFATRARTRMAKRQVELAQLEYIFPRLRRMWTHLERQIGGIGVRGPGEQQLESDRRIARQRILDLKAEIAHIQKRRAREVHARRREFTVSLVGYTNAGKSTLMNALTGANALVGDRLFSTLDTKTRRWAIDANHRVLLSDTVGFIRDLPHHLVASFRATLEEARQAHLLLHLADVSHPQALEQVDAVRAVLEEIGCTGQPRLLVMNKTDAVTDDTALRVLTQREPAAVAVSALTGEGLDDLAGWVLGRIMEDEVEITVRVPQGDGHLLSQVAAAGQVLDRSYDDSDAVMLVRIARGRLSRLRKHHRELIVVGPVPADEPEREADGWPDDDVRQSPLD